MGVAAEPAAQTSFLGGRAPDAATEGEQRILRGADERECCDDHHQQAEEQSGGVAGGDRGDRNDRGDEPGHEDDEHRRAVPPAEEHTRQSIRDTVVRSVPNTAVRSVPDTASTDDHERGG